MRFILAGVYIFLISADEKYYDAEDTTNEFPLLCKNCAGAVLSHASANQWKRMVSSIYFNCC